MQKNHKQWMCMFLSIMLCLSFLLSCVVESDAEQWENSGAREYYLGILEDLKVFQSDEYLYYWRTVNSIEKDKFLAFAIDVGAKVIEKYPTKEDYGRVLSYVLTMQQINIAANISEQSAFDDFRNTGDYVLDVTDIALSLLGIPETTSAISPVVGVFSFGKDTFSATSDSLTYYEMAITDYVCSDLFLKALIDNTDDEMLKAVAHTFLNENVSLLNKKLEIIGDCGESVAGNLGNYYIENIFFKTLQALDGTDMESVRWLGEAGEGFYNAVISTPKLAFDITMLAGNSLFGTSDQYKTYQEMTILAEVARSLSCEIQKTDVKNAKGQELEYALNKSYYLYKALITTGCRGEYLFFHLLDDHSGTNRGIVEFFTGKKLLSTDQIDELQEKQFNSIAYYYNVLVKSYQNQRRSICVSHCWENDRCTICGRVKIRENEKGKEIQTVPSEIQNLSLYLSKAIRAKEQTMQLDHMNDDIVNKLTYGLLMDWDNDGTKELFLSYLQPHSWYGTRKVGLYDIQSGEVTVITEDLNTGVDYACAGLYGLTGITMFQGAPAVFACIYSENTSPFSEDAYQTIKVSFTLWDIHSQRVLHEAVISCDGNYLAYSIDDTACSEADFYSLIDGCSFLTYDSAPPTVQLIYNAELISVDELISAMQENAVQSDTVENISAKQPTQIRRIEESGDVFTVSLQFDSDGRLVSSKNSSGYFETYTYDEEDRLIVVDNSVWKSFGPMYEYRYDENGYLVEISGIGEGGGADLSIDNDQNGRVIREKSVSDFGTTITEYTYNEDGSHVNVVITNTSEYLPPIEHASYEYEYDNQGRILAVTFTGESYSYCVTYDYGHPPFTLICDENGIPYRCEITDCTGRKIWSMELWPILQPIEYDEDGYISRIVSEGAIYEFYYSQP